jgi:hypothetical protein
MPVSLMPAKPADLEMSEHEIQKVPISSLILIDMTSLEESPKNRGRQNTLFCVFFL